MTDIRKDIFYLFHFILKSFFLSIFTLMLLILLFFFIYLIDNFYNSITNKNLSPLFSAYVIASESMTPTIQVNDGIIIRRVDHDLYRVGDIITFSTPEHYNGLTLTHRIVKKEQKGREKSLYTTKGDYNPIEDPYLIETNSIYGKVLLKIPKVGIIQNFFSHPTNYFFTLLLISTLFILYEIGRIFKIFMKKEEMEEII